MDNQPALLKYFTTDHLILLLEGVFKNFRGDFDLLYADHKTYLQLEKTEKTSQLLYSLIRRSVDGYSIIYEDDKAAADRVAGTRQLLKYNDDLNLLTFAYPLYYKETHLATLIFGRFNPTDTRKYSQFVRRLEVLEKRLELKSGELQSLAEKIPSISTDAMVLIERRVRQFASLVTSEIATKQQQQELAKEAKVSLVRSSGVVDVNKAFQFALQQLTTLTENRISNQAVEEEQLWSAVNAVLNEFMTLTKASCVLLLDAKTGLEERYEVVSSAPMLPSSFSDKFSLSDDVIKIRNTSSAASFLPYTRNFRNLHAILIKQYPKFVDRLKTSLVTSVRLTHKRNGILVFIFSKDQQVDSGLESAEIVSILDYLSATLTSTFLTWSAQQHAEYAHEQRLEQEKAKTILIEKVTHQIMSPLQGIQGNAGIIKTRIASWQQDSLKFKYWQQTDLDWLINKVDTLVSTASYTANVATNLSWSMKGKKKDEKLDLEIVENVVGLLIDITRSYQGLATEGNMKISVDPALRILDQKIMVDDNLFRQAIGNLIDNAVKYSNRNTWITVSGGVDSNFGAIYVTNSGIRLFKDDIEKVFDYSYRSLEARHTNAVGTGIGLAVAREIIELHGGKITVSPSEQEDVYWKTTFTVKLPLKM